MKLSIARSSDLIPHESSPLPPGPWLIFAPHPDDETLGMGGTMLLARQQGIEINLVVLTDGARGGNPSGPALTAVREAEVQALAAKLGLHSFEFWHQPDGRLTITDELVEQVTVALVTCAPATVFFPTPLELDADHRVAAALVWQGLQRGRYVGAVYAYEISVAQVCNRLIDITNVAGEKRRLMDCYPSQLSQNNYVAMRVAMDITRSYTLPLSVECAESFFAYPEGASGSLLAPLAAHFRNYWANIGPDPLPLVSVILRTKDRPHLLQEALQSVVLQTYPHIELVVVNDGGCDVADLVQGYEPVLSRVCYVNLMQGQGRAGAANTGLDAASGDYLIFLDDDDLFDPEHVAGLVQALMDNPDALAAYAGVRVEGDKREPILHSFYDQALLRARNLFPIHAVLFSARLIRDGCRFDPTLTIPIEDWDFWLQVAERTFFCG
jgi:LmbE family N-acetylglucosaminyl deacetylase